jgi:peroxin-6
MPFSAWLTLNDQLKADVGLLSTDLALDLFGQQALEPGSEVRYAAIAPWSPLSSHPIEEAYWTVLPVKTQASENETHSTLQFPASSPALKSFAKYLQIASAFRPRSGNKQGFEIRIMDIEPLTLDSVFITVDGEALDRHDQVQRKFAGGFNSRVNGYAGKGKGKSRPTVNGEINSHFVRPAEPSQEARVIDATRKALASPLIVRQGDILHLPLPTHPITHASFPPAVITFCEPVNQGLLSSTTNIVVKRESTGENGKLQNLSLQTHLNPHLNNTGDETLNEHFYSAAEDGQDEGKAAYEEDGSSTSSERSESSEDSLDDSIGDAFPMGTSRLSCASSELKSSITALGAGAGGISTPGSVYSTLTATTARQGTQERGKLFKPRCLLSRIPNETLNPRPSSEEDEEARLYVDIKLLMKLGAFSGDWVKVRAPQPERKDHWVIDAFDDGPGVDDFRVAKVYGLTGLALTRALRYAKGIGARRSSVCTASSSISRQIPDVWLSPILLANMGSPSSIRLSVLTFAEQNETIGASRRTRNKVTAASAPPVAKELTLLTVSTPLVTEQAVQAGLMASTKQHFQSKQRVLRQGDLIPIVFDAETSRILAQAPTTLETDAQLQDLLSMSSKNFISKSGSSSIAWFRAQAIIGAGAEDDLRPTDVWGSTVSIDPSSTRMVQAGNERCKIMSSESGLEFYLGVNPPPKTSASHGIPGTATSTTPKIYTSPLRRRLRELVAATTSPRATHLGLDPMVILLHSTQRNIGKATLATSAVSDLGCHTFIIDAYELLSEGGPGGGDVKTEGIFQARIERALTCGPQYTAILIRHIEALTANRIITALKTAVSSTRIIIATTTEIDQLPDSLRSIFTHELEVSAPDETERHGLLHNIILSRGLALSHDVSLSSIALKSAALVAGDLVDIVDRAVTARLTRLESLLTTNAPPNSTPLLRDILLSTPSAHALTPADFSTALTHARASFATSIGAPKIPSVAWSDVGGLATVKSAIMETIQLPISRPELFAKGMKKRSGILLYGPPGTGKTLLAKAIATEFSLNFFSIKGPELLNMYIGESEANVRRVFQRARDARPCVVFFDELDSVAPKRGNQGDSGGVMDRIVSQLLAELDGMSGSGEDDDGGGRGGVFVIGATNRPDLLDQALLRPGRFDKMLYLGIPDTHEKQLTILQALTRKFALHPELQLSRVAASLPFTYTGADLYALASDAMLKAITQRADAVDTKIKTVHGGKISTAYFFDHSATEEDISVVVTEADFEAARRGLVGSVSAKELAHYATVRRAFEGPEMGKNERSLEMGRDDRRAVNANARPELKSVPTAIWEGKGGAARDEGSGQTKAKGKGKATADPNNDGKPRWESSDEEDEAYETSRDFQNTPDRRGGFRDADLEDEEGLYD